MKNLKVRFEPLFFFDIQKFCGLAQNKANFLAKLFHAGTIERQNVCAQKYFSNVT